MTRRITRTAAAGGLVAMLSGCGVSGSAAGSNSTPSVPVGVPSTVTATPTKDYHPTKAPELPEILDMSWVSARRGWVLTADPCPRPHGCLRVATTADGGRRWRRLPVPATLRGPYAAQGLAFAAGGVGYLFGRRNYVTFDGGRHWFRWRGPHTQALAIAGGSTYRISYHRRGCPGPCDPLIQRTRTGATNWHTIDVPHGIQQDGGELTARGGLVIAWFEGNPAGGGIAHTTLVISQDGGRIWHQRSDPCGNVSGEHEYDATDIAIGSDGAVVALCVGRFHEQRSYLAVSHDAARHFVRESRIMARYPGEVTFAGGHQVVVGTTSLSGNGNVTFVVAASSDEGRSWHREVADRTRVYENERGGGIMRTVDGRAFYVGDPFHIWRTGKHGREWRRLRGPR